MTSLRWRGEGKERGVKEEEGEETDEAKEKQERKRGSIPAAGGGGKGEGTVNKEEETLGGSGSHGHSESEATSESGRDAWVNHRQPGHPRQLAVWLLIVILAASNVLLLYERHVGGEGKKPPKTPERMVELHTSFTPPQSSAFLPFLDSEVSWRSLAGVLRWRKAASSWGWVPVSSFSALLPPDSPANTAQPGHVWTLLPDTTQGAYLQSTRYVPPSPAGPAEELLSHLLSLLHPQPFLMSRYGPRGAAAVVRARTDHLLEIWFRVHAEFQLNAPPRLPLWFTPAAFLGQVVINASDGMVNACDIHVPTTRSLNLDLEWLTGPNEAVDMEVTITHLPEMRVTCSSPVPSAIPVWAQEIPEEAALSLLEKHMYSFMQVQYHNFSDVFNHTSHTAAGEGQQRQQQQSLVHTMVLWGVLSDQSC